MKAILLSLLCSGCLTTSLVALGADATHTTQLAVRDWPDGRTEGNPILGETPSTAYVVAYMSVAASLVVLVDRKLSERQRLIFHAALTTFEATVLWHNLECDWGLCQYRSHP